MKYLVNKKKESGKAHLWDDGDTYCKMYSTGGLRKKRYEVVDDKEDKEVCLMCQNVGMKSIHTQKAKNDY